MATSLDALDKIIPRQKMTFFSPEIESLRGIASCMVVMGHLYLGLFVIWFGRPMVPPHHDILGVVMAGIFDPQPVVLLFFTISGLVLGRQLRKEPIVDLISFTAYLCRRVFRLIPLMWVTTILAFFLMNSIAKFDAAVLPNTLFLKDISINIPLWSLKVELYCSVVFPAIFLLCEFGGKFLNLVFFLLFSLLSFYWHEPIYIQFLVFFHAGLIVDRIALFEKRFNFLLLILATMVMLLAPQFSIGAREWGYGSWQSWVLPEIVACSFILLFVASQKHSYFHSFLRLAPLRYLGKISFSIYLNPFPPACSYVGKVSCFR